MVHMGDRIDDRGRERIAELVRAQMAWAGMSGPRIHATGRVSRATVDRVKRKEEVSETMLRALGDVLGLPRDFLLYVGRGDLVAVQRSAESDPDLVRWAAELMTAALDSEVAEGQSGKALD